MVLTGIVGPESLSGASNDYIRLPKFLSSRDPKGFLFKQHNGEGEGLSQVCPVLQAIQNI